MSTIIKAAAKGLFRPITNGLTLIKETYNNSGFKVKDYVNKEDNRKATILRCLSYIPICWWTSYGTLFLANKKIKQMVQYNKKNSNLPTKAKENPHTRAAVVWGRFSMESCGLGPFLFILDAAKSTTEALSALFKNNTVEDYAEHQKNLDLEETDDTDTNPQNNLKQSDESDKSRLKEQKKNDNKATDTNYSKQQLPSFPQPKTSSSKLKKHGEKTGNTVDDNEDNAWKKHMQ